jgi:DNA-binding SARP family transcriptional activator
VSHQFSLNLLGEFAVYRDGEAVDLPPSCQRVVALSALTRRAVHRGWMCSVLWPYTPPQRSVARLRTTLWRLRPLGVDALLATNPQSVALAPGVSVDWHNAVDRIEQLLRRNTLPGADQDLMAELVPLLRAGGLLEGWSDQWNAQARSRYHTMRTAALSNLLPQPVACGEKE